MDYPSKKFGSVGNSEFKQSESWISEQENYIFWLDRRFFPICLKFALLPRY